MSEKILIAGGCSFSQVPATNKNWPLFLSDQLKLRPFYVGVSGGDNGIISNKVLHQLSESIKKYKTENILLGVMWSGINRSHVYLSKEPAWFSKIPSYRKMVRTHRIANNLNYYLINSHWEEEFYNNYYEYFYDDVGAMISSIKNMLLIQNFCKFHNIKYFFSEYSYDTVTNSLSKNHPDVLWLYKMIDFNHFLPIKNMRDWCVKTSGLEYLNPNDDHPTSEMSKKFTETIIIPFLIEKNYIQS